MLRAIVTVIGLLLSGAGLMASEQNQKLLALSEEERHAALAGHVRDFGKDCNAVVCAMQLTDEAGKAAVWSVGCRNEKAYAVSIVADTKLSPFVVSCEDLKDLGKMLAIMSRRMGELPPEQFAECWKKF